MRDTTIARNYAEAFLVLATKANDREGWGRTLSDIANAVERDERLRRFLEAPQISGEQKNEVLAKALGDRMARPMLRFLQILVKNRRQMLIPTIAAEYQDLVDAIEGRVHARVTVARDPAEDERRAIAAELSRALERTVVPHFVVNPAILGGVVVRVGDTVMDGSVRRRLGLLRSRMVAGR